VLGQEVALVMPAKTTCGTERIFFLKMKQEGIKPLLQYIEKTNKGTGTGGKKKPKRAASS
jgi:hypothetical protein